MSLCLLAAPAAGQMGGVSGATSDGASALAAGLGQAAGIQEPRRRIVPADPKRPRRVAPTSLCEDHGRLSRPVRRPAGYYCGAE